jgi:hypothetical protein
MERQMNGIIRACFLARQDVSGQRVDELVDQYKGVIEAAAAPSARRNIGA